MSEQCTVFETPDETIDYWESLARQQGVFVSREGNTLTISAPIVWTGEPVNGRGSPE